MELSIRLRYWLLYTSIAQDLTADGNAARYFPGLLSQP